MGLPREISAMPLNLDLLNTFLVTVEEGSINRAAARLLRAQPAVGRQIRLLEESLGTPLLLRSSSGVRPTAAGDLLLRHARDIMREVTRAETAIGQLEKEPQGHVIVALPTSLVDQIAIRLFVQMQDKYPGVRLELREGDSHAVLGWIKDGTADLGLLPEGDTDPSLHSIKFASQILCFCGRADRFAQLPSSISWSDALAYPLALSIRPNRLRHIIDNIAHTIGCEVRPIVEAGTTRLVSLLVYEGSAFTIRPYVGKVPDVVDGIALIPICEPQIIRNLSIVWAAERTLSSAIEATKSVLANLSSQLPATEVVR